jgi:hypothetical protein
MKKHPLVRTIYLYLFALVGLTLLIIGTVRFLDMGLKIFVFTKAEEPEKINQEYKHYNPTPFFIDNVADYEGGEELTEEEKMAVKEWYQGYKNWKDAQSEVDYLTSRRHEDASLNLSLILIGLPLYLYHWRIIRRESRESED